MMKKNLPLGVVGAAATAILAFALVGCSSAAPEEGSEPAESNAELAALVPEDIAEAGVLRIATTGDAIPFSMVDETDGTTLIGFDVDFGRAIAESLGLEVEYVKTSFDGIIPALESGTVDIGMNTITATKERQKVVDFASYFQTGTQALVKAGNPLDIRTDQLCGAKVGVVRGSVFQSVFVPQASEECTAAGEQPLVESVYNNFAESLLALDADQIDTVVADYTGLVLAVEANPDFELAEPLIPDENPISIALVKGNPLMEAIHAAVQYQIDEGDYIEMLTEYGLERGAITESVLNGAVN